ncbi:MAG: ROK family protein [Alicyclobacillus sp.]|nr:ROK family protein [Alicyclobacillus sp.]
MTGWVLGVDVGGTKIHLALAKDGAVKAEQRVATEAERGGADCVRRLLEAARDMLVRNGLSASREGLRAVGVGSPGVVDPVTRRTAYTWNIPGWDDVPVAEMLEEGLGAPVIIDNDVNMAALGEWTYGGHGAQTGRGEGQDGVGNGTLRGGDAFAFVAVGTGIGGGIVLGGELWRGRHGAAGEIARWVMDPSGADERFLPSGHLELLTSGTGLEAAYEQRTGRRATGAEIARLSEQGDPDAASVLTHARQVLAIAVANLATVLDLDTVVLGGGVVLASPGPWLAAAESVARTVCLYPPAIRLSALGPRAGLLGAVAQAYRAARA